jgi:hypothetical protein
MDFVLFVGPIDPENPSAPNKTFQISTGKETAPHGARGTKINGANHPSVVVILLFVDASPRRNNTPASRYIFVVVEKFEVPLVIHILVRNTSSAFINNPSDNHPCRGDWAAQRIPLWNVLGKVWQSPPPLRVVANTSVKARKKTLLTRTKWYPIGTIPNGWRGAGRRGRAGVESTESSVPSGPRNLGHALPRFLPKQMFTG